jgi:hypothetical protein
LDLNNSEEKQYLPPNDDLENELEDEDGKEQEDEEPEEMAEPEPMMPFHLRANVFQIAMINKMLPKAYKFDLTEVIKR